MIDVTERKGARGQRWGKTSCEEGFLCNAELFCKPDWR
jgi:hypothetical protein